MSVPFTRQQAVELIFTHISNRGLQKHCLAVGAAMKALAKHFDDDAELWEIIGILHDADWEETKDAVDQHTRKTVQWVSELSLGKEPESIAVMVRTILSHNYHNNGEPEPSTNLEWSLSCCDELTGIIVANALIMPSKKLADISPESVIKKMNSKSFAAAVDRSGIVLCEEKLGIKLYDFVTIVLR
ncbi:HAD family hydrolase, partial [Candidatus Woesebacteria bacterium]|nr:HAD family hydrolase [Candidatus Woesebacteria bacterium]